MKILEDSVQQLKDLNANLDICIIQSAVSPQRKETTPYYMTLLAHAVVQRQKGLVDFLLKSGASTWYNNQLQEGNALLLDFIFLGCF